MEEMKSAVRHPQSPLSSLKWVSNEERTRSEYLSCPIRHVISRFGQSGTLRFSELRRMMTDCSQKMLSQTLKNLEQTHLVHREVFPEVPPRVEYSLTDTGRSLMPALSQLVEWGIEHFNEVVTK